MKLILITSALLMASVATAQGVFTPVFDTVTIDYAFWETPYLHYAHATDTTRKGYAAYYAGNWLSFSGNAREATKAMEAQAQTMGMDTSRYERFLADFSPIAAVKSLLQDAEAHEIVIINEAHHEPRHRVFTRSLLQGLYDRGYRHFGLETLAGFGAVDSLLQTGHYPELAHGYYTREPQFAATVAEAVRIGFHIFGYEQAGTGDPKLRELGQMRNIMAYRAKNPEGKLLLHVGYSHANEGELGGRWEKAMAQRLADTTRQDPLTINQTHFREMVSKDKEQFEYRDFPVNQPSVFVSKTNEHWNFNNKVRWFDRYVFHPRTVYQFGRPDYVFANNQRPAFIDFSGIELPGPYLVQAYGMDDDLRNTVPRDVIETNGQNDKALALPEGNYRLLVTTPDGSQFLGKLSF